MTDPQMCDHCHKVQGELDEGDIWLCRDCWRQERMPLLCTVAVLAKQDGHVLCVSRKRDPSKWTLPGGKLEAKDFPGPDLFPPVDVWLNQTKKGIFYPQLKLEGALTTAAKRELAEETGLGCSKMFPIYANIDDWGHWATLFEARTVSGTLRGEPGTEAKWMRPDELIQRAAFPAFLKDIRDAGLL